MYVSCRQAIRKELRSVPITTEDKAVEWWWEVGLGGRDQALWGRCKFWVHFLLGFPPKSFIIHP